MYTATMKNIDLRRLQGKYIEIVRHYMYKHDMTKREVAMKIKQHESIFCDLMNKKRELSALYLLPALTGGLMTAEDIYDGNPKDDKERAFWARQFLTENPKLVDAAAKIQALGGDPVEMLEIQASFLEKSKGKKSWN